MKNDDGNTVAFGKDDDDREKYYCGAARDIPGTDGRCGPSNGPQCESCVRFQKYAADYDPSKDINSHFKIEEGKTIFYRDPVDKLVYALGEDVAPKLQTWLEDNPGAITARLESGEKPRTVKVPRALAAELKLDSSNDQGETVFKITKPTNEMKALGLVDFDTLVSVGGEQCNGKDESTIKEMINPSLDAMTFSFKFDEEYNPRYVKIERNGKCATVTGDEPLVRILPAISSGQHEVSFRVKRRGKADGDSMGSGYYVGIVSDEYSSKTNALHNGRSGLGIECDNDSSRWKSFPSSQRSKSGNAFDSGDVLTFDVNYPTDTITIYRNKGGANPGKITVSPIPFKGKKLYVAARLYHDGASAELLDSEAGGGYHPSHPGHFTRTVMTANSIVYKPETKGSLGSISGEWSMYDAKRAAHFHYRWKHTPGSLYFSGSQLKEPGSTEEIYRGVKGRIKADNTIEWTIANVIYTAKMNKGLHSVSEGEYHEYAGLKKVKKVGDFLGVKADVFKVGVRLEYNLATLHEEPNWVPCQVTGLGTTAKADVRTVTMTMSLPLGVSQMSDADGNTVISSVEDGGEAKRCGVQVGMKYISIDGRSVLGVDYEAIVPIIKSISGAVPFVFEEPPAMSKGRDGVRFYCGRQVGNDSYHHGPMRWCAAKYSKPEDTTTCSCDGQCGPGNGCQCRDCYKATYETDPTLFHTFNLEYADENGGLIPIEGAGVAVLRLPGAEQLSLEQTLDLDWVEKGSTSEGIGGHSNGFDEDDIYEAEDSGGGGGGGGAAAGRDSSNVLGRGNFVCPSCRKPTKTISSVFFQTTGQTHTCIICAKDPVDCMFDACGHVSACQLCARQCQAGGDGSYIGSEKRQSCSNCGKLAYLGDSVYRSDNPKVTHDLCGECFDEIELQVFNDPPKDQKPILKEIYPVRVEKIKGKIAHTLSDEDLKELIEVTTERDLILNDKKGSRRDILSGCCLIASACEENRGKTPVAKVSRWEQGNFSAATKASAILLPPATALWPGLGEPKRVKLTRKDTTVGWGLSVSLQDIQGRRHVCIESIAGSGGAGLKELKKGDTIHRILYGAEVKDAAQLNEEQVHALFSKDSFKDETEIDVEVQSNPGSDVFHPIEKLRRAAGSKCVVVGIFKSEADLHKTMSMHEKEIKPTVTCDPSRPDPLHAKVQISDDASRFLLHPSKKRGTLSSLDDDLNWFAAFKVGESGRVDSIPIITMGEEKKTKTNNLIKPKFTNNQPFTDIQISSNMQDVFVSQNPNEENSIAISLNIDPKNQSAQYHPLDKYIEESLPDSEKDAQKRASLSKGTKMTQLDEIVVALQNDGISGVQRISEISNHFQDFRDGNLMFPAQLKKKQSNREKGGKVTLIDTADLTGERLSRNALLAKIGECQHDGADLILVPKKAVSLIDLSVQIFPILPNQQIGFSVADEAKDGHPVVSAVAPGSIAAKRNLKVGDSILMFKGEDQTQDTITNLQAKLTRKEKHSVDVRLQFRSIGYESPKERSAKAVNTKCPGGG